MTGPLSHPDFRRLFAAQVAALLGTGLLTVALGLLAFDLRGDGAALILGAIFTIKMLVYVALAPVAAALAANLPRRGLLVTLDIVRAGVALALPWVGELWQVFALVFILHAASAAFTPAFQAAIPEILTDEGDYTHALSLSRLAYDLENILSPALAALILLVAPFDALFAGTLAGFALSAAMIARARVPAPRQVTEPFRSRALRGIRIYRATPRLRGLLALNLAASAGGAMVIVNTVVLVRADLGLGDRDVALALGAFGAGSMIAALALPRLLDRVGDRPAMLAGAATMTLAQLGLALAIATGGLTWPALLATWAMIGLGYSAILTPSGRLLRRSAQPEDRGAIFAAQFSLSHACWLVTYPLAGWLMTAAGAMTALLALAGLSGLGLGIAARIWPRHDATVIAHRHDDLPDDHPHVRDGRTHAHPFRIDDLHTQWPSQG